jgi:hypothetical protein
LPSFSFVRVVPDEASMNSARRWFPATPRAGETHTGG